MWRGGEGSERCGELHGQLGCTRRGWGWSATRLRPLRAHGASVDELLQRCVPGRWMGGIGDGRIDDGWDRRWVGRTMGGKDGLGDRDGSVMRRDGLRTIRVGDHREGQDGRGGVDLELARRLEAALALAPK